MTCIYLILALGQLQRAAESSTSLLHQYVGTKFVSRAQTAQIAQLAIHPAAATVTYRLPPLVIVEYLTIG